MIINSDERQWTWMDEGLNTFCQYLTEKEWDRNYPVRRGPARNIAEYMGGDKSRISPIMTNSESVYQFGNNAYGKPATALNILRETVMGRELFDYAFNEYARRWAFKHPTPADFFRTMEDASGVDLDWFWRGWFFTTDHCDMNLKEVKWYQIDTKNPSVEKAFIKEEQDNSAEDISEMRDADGIPKTRIEGDESLKDFYTEWNRSEVIGLDEKEYANYLENLSDEEKSLLNSSKQFYEVTVENVGGLVMPLIFKLSYTDGTEEIRRIPAEIWRMSEPTITKVLITEKEVTSIVLDPYLETADTDLNNNSWPARPQPTRFEMFKNGERGSGDENPMQRYQRNESGE
jgi:hypothetical protein